MSTDFIGSVVDLILIFFADGLVLIAEQHLYANARSRHTPWETEFTVNQMGIPITFNATTRSTRTLHEEARKDRTTVKGIRSINGHKMSRNDILKGNGKREKISVKITLFDDFSIEGFPNCDWQKRSSHPY